MLFSFLAAATWIPAVLGFGAWLRLRPDEEFRLAVQGFAGLAVLSTIGMLAHFVIAVSPALSWALLAIGTLAFVVDWRTSKRKVSVPILACHAAALLAVAAFAQLPERHYDSGLYYLQAVAWITDEPLVRGLANVHFRLGFNSSWFAAAAATEHGLLAGKSSFYLGILPVFFAGTAVHRAARSLVEGDRSFATLFLALGAVPVVLALESLGGLGQDHLVMLVIYLVAALSIRAMTRHERASAHLAAAVLLSVWAATIKLSAAPLPAFVVALSIAYRSEALRYLFPAAVLVVPWSIRGVLLSGCVAFPAATTCVPALEWGVPRPLASHVSTVIRDWARAPTPNRAGLANEWFAAWLRRSTMRLVPLGGVLLAGIGVVAWRRPVASRGSFATAWGAAIVGTAYWFITAPDVRFGLAFLVPVAFMPLAYGLSDSRFLTVHARKFVVAITVGGMLLAAAQLARYPWPGHGGFAIARWPEFPSPATTPRIAAGVSVRVPVQGDQCWASPRPCTPALLLSPDLVRDASGYRSAGRRSSSQPMP
jgi:hypothetical protein